jgi:uncharacterized protein YheU (UPF0270 family)
LSDAVEIPCSELSESALRGIVESFVLREGTDYGTREFSLEQKVAHVMSQLKRAEARIIYDSDAQTVDIVVSDKGRKR